MYPNLYYAIKDWFGVEINALKIFYTFGIFVALAFIIGALVISKELKRKEKQGLLLPREETITVGKPISLLDILINGFIGFVFGYKLLGAFLASREQSIDLQEYIFSLQGSIIGGIILAALLIFLKYREKNKQRLPKPEERIIRIWPHDRVGDIIVFALIFGILGAKLFDNFENWDRFIKNPVANLFSPSGLTFYGGLICAAIAIAIYVIKKGINVWHMADAIAPALMIAYAIGRIGCQVSGDGDWGIYNSAYISDTPGHVINAQPQDFQKKLNENAGYFLEGKVQNPDSTTFTVTDRISENLSQVPNKSFKGSSLLPVWFFAYTFPHNVNEDGILIPDCEGKYCRALPQPVFPTSLYEIVACSFLFLILWKIRKDITTPGFISGIYLILNGFERFFIEKIRVNSTYSILGFHPTQAEIISVLLILTGVIIIVIKRKRSSFPNQ
ncbi:MAG: prolipoprotein diacylglyceryl transferase [Bacteroidota bacterium]|nr:prolipoprotein diacylglyceryl transferase [Bacteroidota bacterium]